MRNHPSFSMQIHGAPVDASAFSDGGVAIYFEDGPWLAMHCRDAALASDIANAINGALAKHRAPALQAAEQAREAAE